MALVRGVVECNSILHYPVPTKLLRLRGHGGTDRAVIEYRALFVPGMRTPFPG